MAAGRPHRSTPHDKEIGGYVFDFLFALQDTSTSGLCWAVSALVSHPDVLACVRAKMAKLWSPDSSKPITATQMDGVRYTHALAWEVGHRPPAAGGGVHGSEGRHRVPISRRVVVPGVPGPGGIRPGLVLPGGAPGGCGVPAQLHGFRSQRNFLVFEARGRRRWAGMTAWRGGGGPALRQRWEGVVGR